MRSTLNARRPSSTRSAKSAASADFSTSSSPSKRYKGSVALAAICSRTAAGVRIGIGATPLSESLQDRADDRARELRGDALERGRVRLKERRGIGVGPAAGRFVLLAEHHRGILPQHFVLPHIAELEARRHRDRVAGGELLRI